MTNTRNSKRHRRIQDAEEGRLSVCHRRTWWHIFRPSSWESVAVIDKVAPICAVLAGDRLQLQRRMEDVELVRQKLLDRLQQVTLAHLR